MKRKSKIRFPKTVTVPFALLSEIRHYLRNFCDEEEASDLHDKVLAIIFGALP
jgi:hypothetical protein